MYQVRINEGTAKSIVVDQNNVTVDEKSLDFDIQPLANGSYSLIVNGKSYVAYIEEINREKKQLKLRVNSSIFDIAIQEPIDILLSKMGLDMTKMQKIEPIKAPMPGLILKVMVEEGQQIKKGEPVLILEAMKMENVFKAAADATVKAIKINPGQAVEKGEVLIELA